jgi:hypothetical protein
VTTPAPTDIPALPEFIQEGPLALCSLADIAGVLGFPDSSSLTADQMARIPYLLAKLCRLFRIEAGREFSPGTTTADMMTLAGYIQLPDPLGESGFVSEVLTSKGKVIDPSNYSVKANNRLWVEAPSLIGHDRPGSGTVYTVTYTHEGEVPWDVRATMASAVARYLTVDPNSAVAQSTFLSAEGYHQRIAAWVADTVRLDPADIELARAHRPYRVNIIVHKLDSFLQGRTDWSMWCWGGVTIW